MPYFARPLFHCSCERSREKYTNSTSGLFSFNSFVAVNAKIQSWHQLAQKSMMRILPSCFFKISPTESFVPVCEVIFCAKDVLENSVLLICGTFCPNTDNAKKRESTVKSCFITLKSFQQELSKIRYRTKSGRFLL